MLRYLTTPALHDPGSLDRCFRVFLLIHIVPAIPFSRCSAKAQPERTLRPPSCLRPGRPLGQQYLHYWNRSARRLRKSIRYGQSVGSLVAQRYPYTCN